MAMPSRLHFIAAAALTGIALGATAAQAQLPPRVELCFQTTTADEAFSVCSPASQAYGISVEDWERTTAHYIDLLLAEDRADEAFERLMNIREPKNPDWFMFLQGLVLARSNPAGALFDLQEAIDAGVRLDAARRAQVLAIARPVGREALARLEENAYPADVPSWKMEHRPDSDRDAARRAFTLVLTLEPADAEALAGLERLAR